MGKGTLTICSASAGSGKTYKLTGIYLTSMFKSRYNYRRILAVTFTNKATAEMKSRILDNLHRMSTGKDSDYLPELIKSTGKTEGQIRNEAKEILNCILHDYSRFSVSTIDSFFSKIIRAFAREAGLHSGFSFEIDHSAILSEAVDEMMASSAGDDQLKRWLTNYAMKNIEDERSWNIKDGIVKLAEELFKENYKILSAGERSNLENKEFLNDYIEKIKSIISRFEKHLTNIGEQASSLYARYELAEEMFYQKGRGVPGFIRSLVEGQVKEPNSYVLEIFKDPPRWSKEKPVIQLETAINNGLDKLIREAIVFYKSEIVVYRSAKAVMEFIFAMGILSDVLRNVRLITESENSFLLSDAGEVLSLITGGDQSPFIYEKTGNRYENFMIDEFQDTSTLQWDNFRPLIENSMAEGFDNLVVGDVKQSIYRWRNSDWKILGTVLAGMVDNERFVSNSLKINYRSRSNIIKFNNSLFSAIPLILDEALDEISLPVSFRELYAEAVQDDPGKNSGGYVKIEFLEVKKEQNWQADVLIRLPGVIESLQDKGYVVSDIGIIVRDRREGSMVLRTMIDYRNNCPAEKKSIYKYNVVSNESLLLCNSPAVNFIISVLSVVNNPDDMISRAMMIRFFLLVREVDGAEKASIANETIMERSEDYFPAGYSNMLDTLKQMPMFAAVERIIEFFGLGDYPANVAYLSAFQDIVLGFSGNRNSDIQSFLEWWETTGTRKSVVLPDNQDAMRILTIHKSKGLEFKVVILPFISWKLDHDQSRQTILWVKPDTPQFSDLGIVPVRYGKNLSETIFADSYREEKYSVYLDNLNLLYVALTRAKDAIFGFSVNNPGNKMTIAGVLKQAINGNPIPGNNSDLKLSDHFNSESNVFEFGEIPFNSREPFPDQNLTALTYSVNSFSGSLKLKLHGENYFSYDKTELRKKINYGKIMHEVFENVKTAADVSSAVHRLVLEGRLPGEESSAIETKVSQLLNAPQPKMWFMPGNEVLTEAGILLPDGNTKRPDRIIFREGRITIIDFKFGEESNRHIGQIEQYRGLIAGMGYENIEAFIWYVDNNKIVSV